MAIQSLFGPSPEEVLFARQQQMRQQQVARDQLIAQQGQQFGVFAPLYQAGLRFGDVGAQAMTQALFPNQRDPMLERATRIQDVISRYADQDTTDPAVLTKMSQDFAGQGLTREAFTIAQDARAAKREQQKLDIEAEKLDISREELATRKAATSAFDALSLLTSDGRPVTMNKSTGAFETIDKKTGDRRAFDPAQDKLEYKPTADDPLKAILATILSGSMGGAGAAPKGKAAEPKKDDKKKPTGPLDPNSYLIPPK
jgi:hypothetical protein